MFGIRNVYYNTIFDTNSRENQIINSEIKINDKVPPLSYTNIWVPDFDRYSSLHIFILNISNILYAYIWPRQNDGTPYKIYIIKYKIYEVYKYIIL